MMPTETQFSLDDIRSELSSLFNEKLFVTTQDLSEEIGSSRETARLKLNTLVENGELESRRVGANGKLWYPPDYERTENTQTKSADASGNGTTETENTEDVLFFPSRREIVVSNPDDETRQILSQGAHLVDSTGNGYMYKLSSEDVWNSPYDSFDSYIGDVRSIVGESRWSPSFESRLEQDWDQANTFTLQTKDTDSGPITTLKATDEEAFENAKRFLSHNEHYTQFISDTEFRVKQGGEAAVKQTLYSEGYPVIDDRRLEAGASLDIQLDDLELRSYQENWVNGFKSRNAGVFVGPPGCGKTVAAIGVMEQVAGETLILVPSINLANQWEEELLEKTTLHSRQIGQYHGEEKTIRPVTIATYQTASMTRHRELFNERPWGLVIADECHHAVSKTWKRFHGIQSTSRLGLTATPVRESGSAQEIYTLIGPPLGTDWGKLFADGWVSKPTVNILTVPWANSNARKRYERAEGTKQLIEAAKNPEKHTVVKSLLREHSEEKTIIFVDWLDAGEALSEELGLPFVCGTTPNEERERLFEEFRTKSNSTLLISRVGDEGIDLPDAEIAILTSTMGSSRAQTGQRAGRTMRPMGDATAYVLLTKGSGEADWGRESTQYLSEKGITVKKFDWEDTPVTEFCK